MREDYYQLLDAEPTASKQELRAAYRRVAKRYHPDHNADNPAAEERFKLIVEAWRTLGDEEKRAEYDDWLDRHRRYAHLPELEGLPQRRRRVSARRVQERNREPRRSAGRSFAVRPFLLRPRGAKVSGLSYVMISLCFAMALLPYLRARLGRDTAAAPAAAVAGDPQLGYGESPLPPEEQRRNLENYLRRLQTQAEGGDAAAQYRYGYILYVGTGGAEQDKAAARRWWKMAAMNGNVLAQKMLLMLEEKDRAETAAAASSPAAEPGAEQSTEPPAQ